MATIGRSVKPSEPSVTDMSMEKPFEQSPRNKRLMPETDYPKTSITRGTDLQTSGRNYKDDGS